MLQVIHYDTHHTKYVRCCRSSIMAHITQSMCNAAGDPLWRTPHKACAMLQVIHYGAHHTKHVQCCRWSIMTHSTQSMCNAAGDPLWRTPHKACAMLQVIHYDTQHTKQCFIQTLCLTNSNGIISSFRDNGCSRDTSVCHMQCCCIFSL